MITQEIKMITTRTLTQLDELEALAKNKLDKSIYDFIAGGSGSEWGVKNNRAAFEEYQIIPVALRDVDSIDISLEIFGKIISNPVIIAPCAFHKLACQNGEVDTAISAKETGSLMTLSTMSSCTIEEVASASDAVKWFQLYIFKNRSITESLIRRVETDGYSGIIVTVDVPAMGMRLRDINNQFKLPSDIDAANFREVNLCSLSNETSGSAIKEHTDRQFDASLTWSTIDWLSKITKLPIILKGILSAEDALEALKHKVSGIIVSNHGGRQINSVIAAIDALPDITEAVQGKIPLFVDGGIRSGEDVFKAIALGATAVLIGRPVMWSLAIGGKSHLISTLQQLNTELVLTMRLAGCHSLKNIRDKGLSLLSGQNIFFRKMFQLISEQLRLVHKRNDNIPVQNTFKKLFS